MDTFVWKERVFFSGMVLDDESEPAPLPAEATPAPAADPDEPEEVPAADTDGDSDSDTDPAALRAKKLEFMAEAKGLLDAMAAAKTGRKDDPESWKKIDAIKGKLRPIAKALDALPDPDGLRARLKSTRNKLIQKAESQLDEMETLGRTQEREEAYLKLKAVIVATNELLDA